MKNKLLLFFCMLTGLTATFAQAPQKLSYQAVIRDVSQNLVKSKPIGIRTSILQGSENGSIVYQEIYNPNPTTNTNGLLTMQIGSGIPTSGSYVFENVNWEVGPYYIRTEVDLSGGTSYSITSASELLSVPYALYAASGVKGDKGDKGDPGTGVKIVGSLPSETQLPSNYTGTIGDVYITQNTGHGWMWNGTSFIDIGEIKGPKGDKGDKGDIGLTGPSGPQGDKGDQGEQGEPGVDGEPGPQGDPGPEGPQGETGPQGTQGNPGAQGPPGDANISGTSGFLVKFNMQTSGDNSIIKQENNLLKINAPAGSGGKLNVKGDSGGYAIHGESDFIGINGQGSGIGLRGSGGEYGVVASSGSIRALRVDGSSQFRKVNSNGPEDGIIIDPDGAIANIATYNEDLYVETYNNNHLLLNSSLTSTGNVGIGTSTPENKLTVIDNNGTTMRIVNTGNGNGLAINLGSNIGTALFCNKGSINLIEGSIGIGDYFASYRLHLFENSAAKPTSSSWTISSDARLKKDVHAYHEGLNELLKIRPVWFTYTGEAGMPQETGVGVLAQELQQVAPYMVSTWTYKRDKGDNGQDYLAVDNGPMTYMLINATKELNAEIEKLKADVKSLKSELDELKN